MTTITASPMLSNPEAFHSVLDLRAELHRANQKMLAVVEQLHNLSVRHDQVLEWCTVIATHHEEGNHDEVKKCLDNVVANKNNMQKMQH